MMMMMLQIDLPRPVIDVRTSSEQDKIRESDYNLQIDLPRPVIDVRTYSEQGKIRESDYNSTNE